MPCQISWIGEAMKKFARTLIATSVVATSTITTLVLATPAHAADDTCPAGVSCFYDNINLTKKIWQGPGCGFFNLGTMSPALNDKISSIWNRGTGALQPYNWTGSRWQPVGVLLGVGETTSYQGSLNNIIDAV